MANFDDMKLAVEILTGGKNTVKYDDLGMPSIMVEWPKQKNNALFTGGSDVVHPGSIVNTVEKTMYVGKYLSIVQNDRAYSLPAQEPKHTINFDSSLAACRNKGRGWCLVPFSLWAQIALWCRKNGTMPRGNNNYGQDHSYAHEKGRGMALDSSNRITRTATGSGPATWNHNWLPDGIADLNGNVNEWCAGLRLNNGEIQIIPNANCMDNEIPLTAASTYWKAILGSDGSLVDPGTEGTLKYDLAAFKLVTSQTGTAAGQGGGFTSMGKADDLTVPEIAKALTLYPADPSGDYGGDYRYWDPSGERIPVCGGNWSSAGSAGVFYVHLIYGRTHTNAYIGFRSAFCEL